VTDSSLCSVNKHFPGFSNFVVFCVADEPEGTFERVHVEQQPIAGNVLVRQSSMESILFTVEALQARVRRMDHILRKDAAASRNIDSKTKMPNLSPRALPHANQRGTSSAKEIHRPYTLSTPSPKAISRGGTPSSGSAGAGRTGSGLARRKTSDYDINNMVMPQGAGTTHVEQVRHVDIETPQWRLIENAEQPGPESSSDEVGEAMLLMVGIVVALLSGCSMNTMFAGDNGRALSNSTCQNGGGGTSATSSVPSKKKCW
jgi:hypothetical protein